MACWLFSVQPTLVHKTQRGQALRLLNSQASMNLPNQGLQLRPNRKMKKNKQKKFITKAKKQKNKNKTSKKKSKNDNKRKETILDRQKTVWSRPSTVNLKQRTAPQDGTLPVGANRMGSPSSSVCLLTKKLKGPYNESNCCLLSHLHLDYKKGPWPDSANGKRSMPKRE